MPTFAVYIGRFQPVHKAHISIVSQALKNHDNLIIVLGGSFSPQTIKNPFTIDERMQMFFPTINPGTRMHRIENKKIFFVPVRDYHYNDNHWINDVQQKVKEITKGDKTVLFGHKKDRSSYYLDMFPQWEKVFVNSIDFKDKKINSTDIRNSLFEHGLNNAETIFSFFHEYLNIDGEDFINNWRKTPIYKELVQEYKYYQDYKKQWSNSPFPPVFFTTDVVIVKSGHILLVKRKVNPGKGLYALPGGFLSQTEHTIDSAFREVKEETRIKVNVNTLKEMVKDERLFDKPDRSLRGRSLTYAYYVRLPDTGELPEVRGGDDASHAFWMPIGDLFINESRFFEDHLSIINHFVTKG